MTPYIDIEVTDKYIIREFNENIEILGKTDWKIQLENQLPTSLNKSISIPKHEWHRVIKGTGTLKLKIYKS